MSMEDIYIIAKKNGITVAKLKNEMQEAINMAYKNPHDDGITKAYQNKIPCKDYIPTVNEFIYYVINETNKRKDK
ncbi:sporulation initiation factor Spo0A C-terminal domain-containing protein [Anaerovorax odorimutans]|uniref:sporulation initiation factor Spo0A C-terminal domain-containing protein n=1 Tax=Anaerovorax odorimutans TaxID=109327 RepID=UPI000687EBE2|nr:sporulation initiation factor Spo0A C-terminal domain-containing protein [Anaerovorax odorimutans]